MLTRFFNTIVKNQKVRICKPGALITAFKINNMCTGTFDTSFLSSENKEKILQVINTKTPEDLVQYSITKKHAKQIELYRANNGSFESLDDLLRVYSTTNNKWIYNFYKSIIHGKKKTSKKIISDLVQNIDQKNVNTVLGIHVGLNEISWSLLNYNCNVLQWDYESFPRTEKKENIHSLLQKIIPIARKLPKADQYVMQEINDMDHLINHKFRQIFIEQSIINTIILSYLTMLDSKFNDTTEFVANNICIFRKRVLSKIYGLVIQNETISSQYILQHLLQENDELLKTKEPRVLIRTDLRNMYNAQAPVLQEQMGWSLLIALAFIVHKRTDMILQ